MPELIPPGLPAPATASDDPRIGRWLARRADPADAEIVIVGFPSDEGVRRNGGRPGSAEGPHRIRERLYRLTPDAENFGVFAGLLDRTVDLGDVRVTGDVDADQIRLGDVVGPLLRDKTVIVLGGGHETTFGHFLGYVAGGLEVDILNFDAHADVRPLAGALAHSGSPFRQALEHPSGACVRYRVAGLQPHSLARVHHDYVLSKGGAVVYRHALTASRVSDVCAEVQAHGLVTFDLDAIDAAAAPGVSAPNPGGLDPHLWLHAAFRAGTNPAVRSFDVVELNPRFDVDGRTAQLAALTVWHFLRGMAARQS